MVCSNCGNEITPGSRFCQMCGTPVETQNAENRPVMPEQNMSNSDEREHEVDLREEYGRPENGQPMNQNQPNARQANPNDPYGRQVNPNDPYGQQANPNYPYGQQVNGNDPYGRQANPNYPYGQQVNGNDPYSQQANPNYPYGQPGNQNPQYGQGMNPNQPYQMPQPYQQPYGYQRPPRQPGAASIGFPELIKKYTGFDIQKYLYSLRTDPAERWKWLTIAGVLLVLLFGFLPTFTKVSGSKTMNFYARFREDYDLDTLYMWIPSMMEFSAAWAILFNLIDQPLWGIPGVVMMFIELIVLIGWLQFHVTVGIWFMIVAILFVLTASVFTYLMRRQRRVQY